MKKTNRCCRIFWRGYNCVCRENLIPVGCRKKLSRSSLAKTKSGCKKNRDGLKTRDHVIFKYCLCPKFVELKPLANVEPLPYSAKIAMAFILFFRSGRNEFYLKTSHAKKHTNLPTDVRQREDTAVDLLHVPGTGRGRAIASMIHTKKARATEWIGKRITWWKKSNKRNIQQSPWHFKKNTFGRGPCRIKKWFEACRAVPGNDRCPIQPAPENPRQPRAGRPS